MEKLCINDNMLFKDKLPQDLHTVTRFTSKPKFSGY